ncbi:MAG: M15 family metallopeptidase [Treponemataceae bacterium]|nr:M15 family metallopeptidase [Treponemataceae bacterium]
MIKKTFLFIALSVFFLPCIFAEKNEFQHKEPVLKKDKIKIFQQAYPDLTFDTSWDGKVHDWKVTVSKEDESRDFYWQNGKMLPFEEIENQKNYWPLLYSYPKEIIDPEKMSEKDRERLKKFTSAESRKNGPGTPMFFFDFIYDAETETNIEENITEIRFLTRWPKVHKRLFKNFKSVEKEIEELSKEDPEIQAFIDNMKTAEGFYWRIIKGTNRKSFHSLGTALDIMPRNMYGKEIFWGWAQSKDPENWMLIPLSNRWIPPQAIIDIFEKNGFIWGGKWSIWDNMHFEYHPELIIYNGLTLNE